MNKRGYSDILVLPIIFLSSVLCFAQPHSTHEHANMTMSDMQHAQQSDIIDAMHKPMMTQPLAQTGNADKDYLINMIPHHQGAIDSAKLILQKTQDKSLVALATNIVNSQEKEVQYFKNLLQNDFPATVLDKNAYQETLALNKKIHNDMMQAMSEIPPSDNIRQQFLEGMIAHHQGAVESSRMIISYTKNDTIRKIAESIIKEQVNEIHIMHDLLNP